MTEPPKYGKWEVVKPIARGGQGQVYLVRDLSGVSNTTERYSTLQNALGTLVVPGEQLALRRGLFANCR